MAHHLVPCAACQRHVRSTEPACPFCGAEVSDALRRAAAPLVAKTRLSSLAVMTFRAAAIGAALTACGGDDDDKKPEDVPNVSSGGASGAPNDSSTSGGRTGPAQGQGGTATAGNGSGFGGTLSSEGGSVSIYRATPRG